MRIYMYAYKYIHMHMNPGVACIEGNWKGSLEPDRVLTNRQKAYKALFNAAANLLTEERFIRDATALPGCGL